MDKFNVSDIVYLKVNPDIIPCGHIKLLITMKDKRLTAINMDDPNDPVMYDVLSWQSEFKLEKELGITNESY